MLKDVMWKRATSLAWAGAATFALGLMATPTAAWASTCGSLTSSQCSTTDPGDAPIPYPTFVDSDNATLTFLAQLSPANQGNGAGGAVPTIVTTFLNANGFSSVTYLGRQDGTGGPGGGSSVSTTSTDGGYSGTWTFTPGTTGLVPGFILIHAGGGPNILYEINTPGDSGNWDTSENINNGGQQANLSNFDMFSGTAVPLPAALPLFATGIGGLGLLGWRRKRKGAAALA